MLNFINKTVRPILTLRNIYNSSQPYMPFTDLFDEEVFKQQPNTKKRSQSGFPYPPINHINISHHDSFPQISQIAQISTSHSINALGPKIIQKPSQSQPMNHFSGSFQKDNYNKFSRKVDIAQQSTNAEELTKYISILLKDQEKKQFSSLVKSFLNEEGFKAGALPSKVAKKQGQLFKKIYQILLSSVKEIKIARKLLKLFSETHPGLINLTEIKKDVRKKLEQPQEFKNHMKLDLYQFDDLWLPKKEEKGEPKKHNQFQRLSVKKWDENTEYEINDSVLQLAEKKIFGNKKIVEENIVFKRTDQKANINYNSFGDKWVYAYDLPYAISEQEATQLKNMISERYGVVEQMFLDKFEDFVERDNINYIFEVPDNFKDENKRKRVKLNRVVRAQSKQVTPDDKSLLSKIIRKNLMYRSQSFNKSTLLLKFRDKQSKMNFLTPDLRLYGMCFNRMKNIRFEQALSKNVLVLTMIRWGADSQQLIGHINNILQTLSIKIKHQKCIITKGSVLIEMNNFYEAYHSKNFLHNSNFQNQKIKAQLCYGSSCLNNGQYKYTFQSNHYQKLLSDLKELQEQQRKRLIE